ncbi:MAG: CAP domain-containing protein [Chloroflexota bacterium]|nr:CAP domain-containing protein [Chloroflexota bacterium]
MATIFKDRNRLHRPRRAFSTPRRHIGTAKWVIIYTNQARARSGLRPLARHLVLQSSAQGHSDFMARHAYSHEGVRGSSPHGRMKELGFSGMMTAENIFKYPARRDRKKLAKELVDGWMKSPGHRANILDGKLKYIGVGIAQSGDNVYATQNFGG